MLVLDLLSKYLAVARLKGSPVELIPGVLHLTYTTNTGGAFGMSGSTPWFFASASVIVCGFILFYMRRVTGVWRTIALGMVLGGALGNLINRLAGGIDFSGEVVDFIDLRIWPVFNLADSAIVVGAVILALSFARDRHED
ncbi:MAG: signal peptidase II [Actinobacteria bacterium]|nr:signal peptidase II [Actinomycetota bacterium]